MMPENDSNENEENAVSTQKQVPSESAQVIDSQDDEDIVLASSGTSDDNNATNENVSQDSPDNVNDAVLNNSNRIVDSSDESSDESATSNEKEKHPVIRSVMDLVIMIVIVFVAVILLRTFVITPYEIPSGSMEDTIMTEDYVLSEKISYAVGTPQPGDIVTFKDPEDSNKTLIKRVIAVGGQTIDLKDGDVYVDGKKLDEPYTEGKPSYEFDDDEKMDGVDIEFPYKVPQGEMWMMGDNRTNSLDSRYFGSVPISNATGKAICVYLPINHISTL